MPKNNVLSQKADDVCRDMVWFIVKNGQEWRIRRENGRIFLKPMVPEESKTRRKKRKSIKKTM